MKANTRNSADAHERGTLSDPSGAPARDGDFSDERRTLHVGCAGEVYRVSRSAPNAPKQAYASDWEIALPLAGVFLWKVGQSVSTIDPNCALFISEGQVFSEDHPIRNRGHSAAIVLPSLPVLDQLCGGRKPDKTAYFQATTRLAPPRAQILAHLFNHLNEMDRSMKGEELTIALLEEMFCDGTHNQVRAPQRVVERAKRFLHEQCCERHSLADVAREVGVTPIYLTQAFKKSEGIPLYKYQLRLRLSRALAELPHWDSITDLALELGFSSHSHFSAAFAATYGLSPSEFRVRTRPS